MHLFPSHATQVIKEVEERGHQDRKWVVETLVCFVCLHPNKCNKTWKFMAPWLDNFMACIKHHPLFKKKKKTSQAFCALLPFFTLHLLRSVGWFIEGPPLSPTPPTSMTSTLLDFRIMTWPNILHLFMHTAHFCHLTLIIIALMISKE